MRLRPVVRRVLLVLRGPITIDMVKSRCEPFSWGSGELAVCYELPPEADGFREALAAQRSVTEALRAARGSGAESIAIFAVSGRDGDRVEDCARDWGASEVWA